MAAPVALDNLAYCVFTSGTSGRPRAVGVPHRGLARYALWAAETYLAAGPAGAPVPVHTSIGFDLTLTSLFPVWLRGGRVELLDEDGGIEPLARTAGGAADFGLVKLTPAHLDALAAARPEGLATGWARVLVVGGEALEAEHLAPLRAPRPRVVNEYGPTEAVVGCCAHELGEDDFRAGPVPIGRPAAETRSYVLDAALEPVPPAAAGELWVGGPGLARGYLGQPALTAERFRPDPFGEPGSRAYRTGDRVRLRADGELVFLGRLDDQVKVRGHRVEPGEIAAALRALPGVAAAAVVAREPRPGGVQLAAYWVGEADPAALRGALAKQLPAQLVPAHLVRLERLPLTPHGKLDRAALPDPLEERAPAEPAEGRGGALETLAGIWAAVLGLEGPKAVGVADGFFTLGGDSILGLQVVARAREAGLALEARQLFEHPTLAELAAAVEEAPAALAPAAEQGPVTGPVPLTPVQRWFFEAGHPRPDHWNQALVFELRPGAEDGLLVRALDEVIRHHDLLRARFERDEQVWSQRILEPGRAPAAWSRVGPGEELAPALAAVQAGLDLAGGPLVRAARAARSGRELLLLAIHHLVVDGVSWRVLVEDLGRAYADLAAGRPVRLPPKTGSFRAWAGALEARARDGERELWRELLRPGCAPLPVDSPVPAGAPTEASTRRVAVALDGSATAALLRRPSGGVEALLLAALGRALLGWARGNAVLVDRETHGRDGRGLDVSRTVGWFTAISPVRLECDPALPPAATLAAVEELLARIPDGGLGFGVLRYVAGELRDAPRAEVLFNYLGQLDRGRSEDALLRPSAVDPGPLRDPRSPRTHALEVDARVAGGRLSCSWSYSELTHRRATAAGLAERFLGELRALVALEGDTDFSLAGLGPEARARLASPALERVYPLIPTQQGMLFHGLVTPGSQAYLEQLAVVLEGPLDVAALRRAAGGLLQRHELLRASVAWRGLDEPLWCVWRAVELPWRELDWSGTPAGEEEARLERFLGEERARGFDLGRAPLLRIALVRLGPERHAVVFAYHHVVIDGWSMPILLQELLALYAAERSGAEAGLPPAPPYREFVAWLAARDREASRRYWRAELADFAEATPLGLEANADGERWEERELLLEPDATRRVEALARGAGATLNTAVGAAWALLLARYSGRDDVLFGATVSGRADALPGAESRVGLFINTLPVRVRVPRGGSVSSWLAELQAQQAARLAHEHTPLPLSQASSGVPAGEPLFESLLVFENYPAGPGGDELPQASGLSLVRTLSFERTSYPLTAVAVPGERLLVRLIYDRARLPTARAERMLGHLVALLEGLAGAPDGKPADVALFGAVERGRLLEEWSGARIAARPEPPVHRAFEAQAARTPGAPAVVAGERVLSYAELEARANRLAHRLRARGVGTASPTTVSAGPTPRARRRCSRRASNPACRRRRSGGRRPRPRT